MSKKQNSSTYVGVDGRLMLAKDPRWDISAILNREFDPEQFVLTLELEDKTPLPQMLRDAAEWGFYAALDEFYQFFKAFDRLPGSVADPNDDYPQKYLPLNGRSTNVSK